MIKGLRKICDDESYKIGDYCRHSYDWDFENDCSKYFTDPENGDIGGTCCIWFDEEDEESYERALELVNNYHGDTIIVIEGDFYDWGNDTLEYVLKHAKVIDILEGK